MPDLDAAAESTRHHSSPLATDAGDAGVPTFTFETGATELAAGAESFVCRDFANPFGRDVAVVSGESEIDAAAHHLYVFLLPGLTDTETQGCEFGGLEFHDYLHATQAARARIVYPAGVGRVVGRAVGFRLNLHLLNTSGGTVFASAKFKIGYVSPGEVTHLAHSIFLNNTDLQVPPGRSTITGSFALPYDIELLTASGHMHLSGKHFVATAAGNGFLDTTSSQEPIGKTFDPPLELAAGTAIQWACTYANDSGRVLTYGQSAATNEMCAFAGVFYAKSGAGTDLAVP
jgi:hypothetical protein